MNCSKDIILNKMTAEDGFILPNKTNFINFISLNDKGSFLNQLSKWVPTEEDDGLPESQKNLKPYQLLVANYLQENSPYRGLLLYHGLGAGKTAASITIAEGYLNRKVMVFLPASITNTFKSEVTKFTLQNKNNYWWIHCNTFIYADDQTEGNLIDKEKYLTNKEYQKAVNNYFLELGIDIVSLIEKDPIHSHFTYEKDDKYYIGVWITDLSENGSNFSGLSHDEQKKITNQINQIISNKYKYYSYNGSNFIEKILNDNKDYMTQGKHEDSVKSFRRYLNYVDENGKKIKKNKLEKDTYFDLIMSMNNPFDNNTIIIDEVHNFVSLIKNESKKGTLAYLLLMKAKNVRLVFLSATPAINEPFELSLMINLLKGYVDEYRLKLTFEPTENIDIDRIRDIINREDTIDKYDTLIKNNQNTVSLTLVRTPQSFARTTKTVECDNFPQNACKGVLQSSNKDDCDFNRCSDEEYMEYIKNKIATQLLVDMADVAKVDVSYTINQYSIFPDITELCGKKLIINKQSIDTAINIFKTNYIKIINDKLVIHNERDFIKRSLGCISYFGGIDIEKLKAQGMNIGYPTKKEYIMTSKLSAEQYEVYKLEREEEIQKDNKKRMMIDQNIPSTFRSASRQALLCIYPQTEREIRKELKTDKSLKKDKAKKLKMETQVIESLKYDEISIYSPKYNNVINITNTSPGPVLIYSNYYSIEGLTSLRRYMIKSGYSSLDLKEKEISIEYFEQFLKNFRKEKENIVGKMVIFKLTSKSNSYFQYCKDEYNINKDEEDFDIKIQEFQGNSDDKDTPGDIIEYIRGKILSYNEDTHKVNIEYTEFTGEKISIENYIPSMKAELEFTEEQIEMSINEIYPATIVVLHGNEKNRQNYIDLFNTPGNKYGQLISCILATDVIAEGINLSYIRQVNILNPYWNKVKTDQVIGRATRMKSHLLLQYHQRNVEVFHHLMEFNSAQIKIQIDKRVLIADKTLTTDQYLYNVGLLKENLIKQFLKIMKEVSIDCDINQSGDFMKKDPDVRCISHMNEKIFGFRYDVFSYNLNNLIIDDNNTFLGMPTKTTFIAKILGVFISTRNLHV